MIRGSSVNLSSKLSFMAKADGPNLLSSYVVLGAVCRILSPDHLDRGNQVLVWLKRSLVLDHEADSEDPPNMSRLQTFVSCQLRLGLSTDHMILPQSCT